MNIIQRQFFALYEEDMPQDILLQDNRYHRVKTFKYDFFAATGLYECDGVQIVVKIYRQRRFFGLPMGWTGRLQVRHEERLYRRLGGIGGIPEFLGRVGTTGFAHAFVPGAPLRRTSAVNDDFFETLAKTLAEIHGRGVAYVDLNKSENILLGDDGRPYLIDFQISYCPRRRCGTTNRLLRRLQDEDWYHYRKHKRRIRPDLMTDQEKAAAYHRSTAVRIHRAISRPYFILRRSAMKLLGLRPAE